MKSVPALEEAYRPRRIHPLGVWPLAGALVHPPPDHNSVCIRDLALQAFERDTWIACVLANPDGPDLERYLAATQDFRA